MTDRLEEIKALLDSTQQSPGSAFGEYVSREQLFTDIVWLVDQVELLRLQVAQLTVEARSPWD